MLSASNNGIPRLGVPPLTFGEALHGVLCGCGSPFTDPTTGYTSTGCPTSFPTGLALGGTFNRSLWSLVGGTIGREARSLFNQVIVQDAELLHNLLAPGLCAHLLVPFIVFDRVSPTRCSSHLTSTLSGELRW
jgi:hypothetical protein